jgi:hypothetical protein
MNKMNVYEIPTGNGWLGNTSNLGTRLVMAETVTEAKEILANANRGLKGFRMGRAKKLDVLK